MRSPRANWKGFLRIAEIICPVALYTAASTAERIAFHILDRSTGHRVHRRFIDSETGNPVEKNDQVKGYEISPGDYVVLEADEISSAIPESDKSISVSAFIGCENIDDVYFDKPYYLAPTDQHAEEAYTLIREGMRAKKVAALAQILLFRRVRTLLIRAHGPGLIATTLNFDYEVRSAKSAFEDLPDRKIKADMLELAEYIIETKKGKFDASEYADRYEAALADLVNAKLAGKRLEPRKGPAREKVVDLMAALHESARLSKEHAPRSAPKSKVPSAAKKAAPGRRKAS